MTQFRNAAAEFIYVRTYSRWIDELNRRETWTETVNRFMKFIQEERKDQIPAKVLRKMHDYMISFEVMPSMRALWAAGDAARADNTCLYNCAFRTIDSIDAFVECLYILMCGTGFGFSVSAADVEKLPVVPELRGGGLGTHIVQDSRIGWADSLRILLTSLYAGQDIDMDYSLLRPKGARLKTMGGRSSGPAPLINLHQFARDLFSKAQGRKLTTIECHDLCCQIADVVVVGGVRRSSEISLSDLNDEAMREAKEYPFPLRRGMANNSAIYTEKPPAITFLGEWAALAASGTGERGIFNLAGARECVPNRRDAASIKGTNPCGEIMLRDKEFCNLSEVVVRPQDDLDSLLDKVTTATWLGVIQSTFTHFPYISKEWAQNCNEERLLGVSLTGQMDNPKVLTPDALAAMKNRAIKTARHAAKIMNIPMPAAITCVKPSGTVSQLVDSASGIHPRYADYYIRRYRVSSTDPLLGLMREAGITPVPEVGHRKKDWAKARKGEAGVCPIYIDGEEWSEDKVLTWVVEFPIKAPEGSRTRNQMTAIDQLEWYKKVQTNWCEHNASMTVYVREHEWFEVGNWVYENWDIINGVSFLPFDGGKYELAPYEEITKEEYDNLVRDMPRIDYSMLSKFEMEDGTTGSGAVACSGDKCDIV